MEKMDFWLALKYINFGGYYPLGIFTTRDTAMKACSAENKKYSEDPVSEIEFVESKNDVWVSNQEDYAYTYIVRLIGINELIEL